MSNYQIKLVNGIGKANFGNKNSVKNTKEKVEEVNKIRNINLSGMVKSSTSLNGAVSSGSKLMGAGAVGAAVGAAIMLASKGADLYISYKNTLTGNDVYYGNIKAGKDMWMSLGTNYVKGWIRNEIFTKNIIKRQNDSLAYGQILYNLNNYGEKYKIR